MPSRFAGFSPDALKFLRALKRHNDREWFQPRKEQYESLVKEPMLALVEDLNADLVKFAPDFVTEPKKAVFRIYRDVRFSADKRPYKTNIAASFRQRGVEAGGLYFSVSGEEIEVAAGIYHPSREVILSVRQHIADNHSDLQRLLKNKKSVKLCGELKGSELSRAPKGFDPDHPAIAFIKKKDWLYDINLEPSIATTPELRVKLSAVFKAMHPLVEFLNKPLLEKKATAQPEYHW